MKTIGNILWFIFTGLWTGLAYVFEGIFWCCTFIGIPFGLQCFKIAKLAFLPFGKEAATDFGKHPIANVIWIIFGGLELWIGFMLVGLIWCITFIGIPFGKQCFKLAKLSLRPFGATIEDIVKEVK